MFGINLMLLIVEYLVTYYPPPCTGKRFWYRTTRLSSKKKSRTKSSLSTKRSVPKGRDISAEKRRRY